MPIVTVFLVDDLNRPFLPCISQNPRLEVHGMFLMMGRGISMLSSDAIVDPPENYSSYFMDLDDASGPFISFDPVSQFERPQPYRQTRYATRFLVSDAVRVCEFRERVTSCLFAHPSFRIDGYDGLDALQRANNLRYGCDMMEVCYSDEELNRPRPSSIGMFGLSFSRPQSAFRRVFPEQDSRFEFKRP